MTTIDGVEFLTLGEVAALLRVDARSVHRWIAEGRLVTYKPGKERLIRRTDFEAFVESTREAPGRRGTGPAMTREQLADLDAALGRFAVKAGEALDGQQFRKGRPLAEALAAVGVSGTPPEVLERLALHLAQHEVGTGELLADELRRDAAIKRVFRRLVRVPNKGAR